MTESDERCSTCGNSWGWHEKHKPRHPWNGLRPTPPQVTTQTSEMPFDPVLRMTLINKGVITIDDLNQAENLIRAISGTAGGVPHGDSTKSDGSGLSKRE